MRQLLQRKYAGLLSLLFVPLIAAAVIDYKSETVKAGTFIGNLTGNVTGNVSGSSGSTTGNAATATAFFANPADCAADTYSVGINANGTQSGCTTVTNAGLAGSIAAAKLIGSDIATVGTITSGTWQGTKVAVAYGGTNSSTALNNNRVMQSSGGAIIEASAITASRALISDSNGIPTHSTVTSTTLGFLDVGSSLTTLLAAKAPLASPTFTGTVTLPLTTAGPVITTSGGVISSETALNAVRGGTAQTSVTTGDLLYGSATDTWSKLAKGTSGKTLVQGASTPSWTTLGTDGGGTGVATLTQYGLLLGNGTGAVNFVGPSTQGQILQANGASAAPSFTTAPVVGLATGLTGKYGIDGATSGRIFITAADAAGTYNFILPNTAGNAGEVLTSQGGVSTAMTWVSPASGSGINMLRDSNPKAESGASSPWTNTGGGTLTVTSTAANVGNGTYAFSYDSSAASDHADSPAITIPSGLFGQNCLLEFRWKGFGTSTTFQVHDGTNVIASQAVTAAATTYSLAQIMFACPSSGTLQMRVAASANDAVGYWDEVHLGSATNIGSTVVITPWVTYTPTITNGPTMAGGYPKGYWRRVGDSMEIRADVKSTATGAASTMTISLPSGYTIDSTKLNLTQDVVTFGAASGLLSGAATYYSLAPTYDGSSSTVFKVLFSSSGNYIKGSDICNGCFVTTFVSLPIVGWGNGTVISDQTVRTPTTQVFTSGTSQTYTRPAGVTHIKVRMVGGGGGGSGGGTGACTSGGTGTASTFVQSPVSLSAGGGVGGGCGSSPGGTGGAISTTGASSGFGVPGGQGQGGPATTGTSGNNYSIGGSGASSAFGGGGGGGQANGAGGAAATNTGAGGGAGGTGNASSNGGAGGGSGGYVDVWIVNPAPTFTYTVGAKGAAGSAGTNGFAGAAGADGQIIVEEFYGMNAPVMVGLNVEYPCTFSGPAGYSVNDVAYCLPYLTSGGIWRVRFNIDFNLTNATNPQLTTPFTSYNGGYQAVTCWSISSGQTINYARMDPNSTNINISFAANASRIICSGDVRLASKPTFVP